MIDNERKFNAHIRNVCKTAAKKSGVITRISPLLDLEKEKTCI